MSPSKVKEGNIVCSTDPIGVGVNICDISRTSWFLTKFSCLSGSALFSKDCLINILKKCYVQSVLIMANLDYH